MITPSHFSGKTIAVLGLGRSGMSAVAALRRAGAHVLAWDDSEKGRAEAQEKGIFLTDLRKVTWRSVEGLILSPGIPHRYPSPHPIVQQAGEAGINPISDIELLCLTQTKAQYIGVTGTNGKSTTTALIGHILRKNKLQVEIGGNIGIPVLNLPPLGEEGIYVLEMSSYQLELTPHFHPHISGLVNITPDHLDRHGGMGGYVAAKQLIYQNMAVGDKGVISIDDSYCLEIYEKIASRGYPHLIPVSLQRRLLKGISVQEGALYEDDIFIGDLRELSQLAGDHNWQNIAIAYGTARSMGLSAEQVVSSLASFSALEHRQETVACYHHVTFINDSKGTNAESTAKALACYDRNPLYLLLGGKPKEGGISSLHPYFPFITHAFLYGDAAHIFSLSLEGKVPYTLCETLQEATHKAATLAFSRAHPEAVVLLSPACASFDQFRDFEERGRAFKEYVQEIIRDADEKKAIYG